MSARNTREAKAARRNRKALRVSPPGYIDLVHYVRTRTKCTAGTARKVLLSGALRVDSHPVGFKREAGDLKTLDPMLPAQHRDSIQIVSPS